MQCPALAAFALLYPASAHLPRAMSLVQRDEPCTEAFVVLCGSSHATCPALVRSESWAPIAFQGSHTIGKAVGWTGVLRMGNPREKGFLELIRAHKRNGAPWSVERSGPSTRRRGMIPPLSLRPALEVGLSQPHCPEMAQPEHPMDRARRTECRPFRGMDCGNRVARGVCAGLVSSSPRCGKHQARSRHNDSPGGKAIQLSKAFPRAGTSAPRVGKRKACRRRKIFPILARLVEWVSGDCLGICRSQRWRRAGLRRRGPRCEAILGLDTLRRRGGILASSVREGRGQTVFPSDS